MAETIGNMTVSEFLKQLTTGDNNSVAPNKPAAGKDSTGAAADNVGRLSDNAGKASGSLSGLFSAATDLANGFAGARQQIGRESQGLFENLDKYSDITPAWVSQVGTSGLNQLQSSREASATGAGGGEFVNFERRLRASGLTLQDYNQIMNRSRGALQDFGSTAQERATELADTGAKVQKLSQQNGLNLQFSEQALGRITGLSQYGRTEALTPGKKQDEAAEAASHLAKTINQVAAATGKNREAITAELEERLSSAEVQAKLKNATEEQRKAIIENQASLSGMGKTAGDTAMAIQNNGRLTQDQQVQLMSMGPKAMSEFVKANRILGKDPNSQEGKDLLLKSQADKAAFQGTARYQQMMQNLPDNLKGGFKTSYQEDMAAGGMRYAMNPNNRAPGQTPIDAVREQQNQARNISESRTPSGQINPNVAPTAGMAALQGAAFNQANEALSVFSKNLNTIAGSKAGQEALASALTKIYGKGGELDKVLENVKSHLQGTTGNPGPVATSGPNASGRPLPKPKPVEKKAAGGPVNAEEVYMVGENGPELFKSKSAGDIVPTDKLNNMFSGIKTKISGMTGGVSGPPLSQADITSLMKAGPNSALDFIKSSQNSIPKIDTSKLNTPATSESTEKAKQTTSPTTTAARTPEATAPTNPLATSGAQGEVTLKDIHTVLQQLNKTMGQVASHSEAISHHSEKTAKMSAKATGNRTLA